MGKEIKPINNLIVNRGTYDKITQNLSQIADDSIIITDDKTIPVPTTANNGQFLGVSNGEFAFMQGGGGAVYWHRINFQLSGQTNNYLNIFSTNDTAFDLDTLSQLFNNIFFISGQTELNVSGARPQALLFNLRGTSSGFSRLRRFVLDGSGDYADVPKTDINFIDNVTEV